MTQTVPNDLAGQGLVIAATGSAAGKTTITLGILAALAARGMPVRGAKCGPDYIDARFHQAASGQPCLNLDPWAMTPDRIRALAVPGPFLVVEGVMGLFDGAANGQGTTADLAATLGLPVILVVDAAHMAQSVAALVGGFARHREDCRIAGVILNKVGSARHEAILRDALLPLGIPVLGAVPRQAALTRPSRHLGLVLAEEHPDLDAYLARAAALAEAHIDLAALCGLAAPLTPPSGRAPRLDPPAQKIAVASDAAFAFAYPHILADWRAKGAEIAAFSPLADQAPPADADMVFLPGGYPELYAGQIAAAERFRAGLARAAAASVPIYGECGGYMVLGEGLVDADGARHRMLGLLPLETSFAQRELHLGYRQLTARSGPFAGGWMGHEFHYATTVATKGAPLFAARDATGLDLSPMGLQNGAVCGSFAHLIDRRPRTEDQRTTKATTPC